MSSMGAVFAGVVHGLLVSLAGLGAWLAGGSNERGGGGDGLSMPAGMGISLYHGSNNDQTRACDRLDRAGCNRFSRFLLLKSADSARAGGPLR
jgi:hypothetical protein